MKKATIGVALGLALGLSATSTPVRADGGATAAIIIGAAALTTVGCYGTNAPPLCVLSPVWWVDSIVHPHGTVIVTSKKKKK